MTNIERGNPQLTVKTINALASAMGYEVRVKFVQARSKTPNGPVERRAEGTSAARTGG